MNSATQNLAIQIKAVSCYLNSIKLKIGCFCLFFCILHIGADTISITDIKLASSDLVERTHGSADFRLVRFNVRWDRSWRNDRNWDALWVFLKFRVEQDEWKHCTLNIVDGIAANDGHKEPSGATITTSPDGKGVFIYRNKDNLGYGAVSFENVMLRWNSGKDEAPGDANIDVQVFGIEMVYVPAGVFAVGTGGTEFKAFQLTTINTVKATTLATGNSGISGSPQGGYPMGEIAPDSPNWPNGFHAFYCMKYEVTQGQYTDFLNTLSVEQAQSRYSNRRSARYTIRDLGNTYKAEIPNRACNFLSWADGAAFADWAALRPFTEMEYEKACRGPGKPVPGEYAWGTTSIHTSAYDLADENTPTERIVNLSKSPIGNAAYNETNGYRGPYRSGIFVASLSEYDRQQAGASFYDIMELSGNLWERTVSIGHPEGRKFKGQHGDGRITPFGDANVDDWPGADAAGVGFRGGGWRSGATVLRVSDRVGANDIRNGRSSALGFRAVRTAPSMSGTLNR